MSIEHTDSDQTLPLTLVSSFGPLDTVTINMATSAGQPVVTNQTPNPVTIRINVTGHSIVKTSTNQGASGCCIQWFRLEGHSGCSLGPAQMECQSIASVVHQELGVMPMWSQQLN